MVKCDSNLVKSYEQLVDEIKDEAHSPSIIQKFYRQTNEECHNEIVRLVMDDLFSIAYAGNVQDSTSASFLQELSNEESLSKTNRIKALLILSNLNLFILQRPDSAISILNESKNGMLGKFYDDTLLKGYNSIMAQALLQKSELKQAASYYVASIKLSEKMKDSNSLAKLYANFGGLYTRMGEYTKAIEMQKRAYNYFERNGITNSTIIANQGIAVNYGLLEKYDSALTYYNKCLTAIPNEKSSLKLRFQILFSVAGIYTGKNDYDKAIIYYNKAKAILEEVSTPQMKQSFVMASTPAYAKVRNVDEEFKLVNSYIPLFYQNKDLVNVRNSYHVLFHTLYVQEKYIDALKYYKKWDSIGDILSADENKQYIAELDTKYQTEKKELKIKVQQKALQQKNTLNSFLLALLALGGLGAAFIVTRVKLKRKKKEANLQQHYTQKLLENTEDERKRIARDLHDGVSQELMILKNQVHTKSEHLDHKIDLIINEIRMISRDLHPVMLDQIGLKASIEYSCEQMMEIHQLFISAEVDYNNSLPKHKELQIYRIIQEGLNNIIKYAKAEAAKITLIENKESLLLRIEDNGHGFDVDEALTNKKSFGLINIIQRSKTLGGKSEITSSNKGTIIKIELPK